jgi:hypothetical protein
VNFKMPCFLASIFAAIFGAAANPACVAGTAAAEGCLLGGSCAMLHAELTKPSGTPPPVAVAHAEYMEQLTRNNKKAKPCPEQG